MKKETGITLIALIITIIILVILAAVTINSAYNSGIIDYAVNGTQNYIQASKKEQDILSSVEEQIKNAQIMTDPSYDIYAAFISSTGTLKFASTKEGLGEIDTGNGDIYYDKKDIKGKGYSVTDRVANTPWFDKRENITKVEFVDTIKPTNTMVWFYRLANVTEIDVANLDTSECTDMRGTFNGCSGLTRIDNIDQLVTDKVKNMRYMFTNCYALQSLDLSGFNTENVESMEGMFYCEAGNGLTSSLGSITFGNNFKTNKVKTMRMMFDGCNGLTSLAISGWNTQNVENMSSMFLGCSGLTSLNLNGWNTQNVETMYSMFANCTNLETLTLSSNFKTDNVTTMRAMFQNCSSLQSLDVSSWNVEKVTTFRAMFNNCTALSVDCSDWTIGELAEDGNLYFAAGAANTVIPPTWNN